MLFDGPWLDHYQTEQQPAVDLPPPHDRQGTATPRLPTNTVSGSSSPPCKRGLHRPYPAGSILPCWAYVIHRQEPGTGYRVAPLPNRHYVFTRVRKWTTAYANRCALSILYPMQIDSGDTAGRYTATRPAQVITRAALEAVRQSWPRGPAAGRWVLGHGLLLNHWR